jgi:hypothetical protein
VEALLATTKLLDQWMKTCATDPDLRECIYEYAIGQGGVTVEAICTDNRYYGHYRLMARAKDAIRWQQFMVGMIWSEIWVIQTTHTALSVNAEKWTVELITKLLKVTHGQWLYRNVQVHDKVAGTLVTLRKEEIQMQIEERQALGTAGLLDEDCHLGECNLGDLKDTSGIKETYWLLAIKAAQEASRLEVLWQQAIAVALTT